MSNPQPPSTPQFLPPILLATTDVDQLTSAKRFMTTKLDLDSNQNQFQLQIINQELTTVPIAAIRQLISELAFASYLGKTRVIIILAAELISLPAQHAFLKSLEEPPAKTQLILVTAHPNSLLETIRSRCVVSHWSVTNNAANNSPPVEMTDLPPALSTLLTADSSGPSYTELIEISSHYTKREQALELISHLITLSHSLPSNPHLVKVGSQLLTTHRQLQQNVNVKLALENCFFQLKKLLSNS